MFNSRKKYILFMQSSKWRTIRKKRLAIDKYRCVKCKSKQNLEVHHLTYKRFGGREKMKDLQTLCRTCHRKIHNTKESAIKKFGENVVAALFALGMMGAFVSIIIALYFALFSKTVV